MHPIKKTWRKIEFEKQIERERKKKKDTHQPTRKCIFVSVEKGEKKKKKKKGTACWKAAKLELFILVII